MIGQSELTREEVAHIEVGYTDVTPTVARTLFAAFLVLMCVLPLYELSAAAGGDPVAAAPWRRVIAIPREMGQASGASAWGQIVAKNRALLSGLHDFEDALEDDSSVGRLLRPRAQALLTGWLGAGNEQAYIGRDRWLFYRSDVEYATAPGFLRHEVHTRRIQRAGELADPPRPDPRPAIVAFKEQLDRLGIALVLLPVPVKPTVHPEMLSRRAITGEPVQNADYARLIAELRNQGVNVVDIDTLLANEAEKGITQYLATDTHWRPEAMEAVAARLADVIRRAATLPAAPDPGYRLEAFDVEQRGDIFHMLDLPPDQRLFDLERITVRRVLGFDGTPWRSSPGADVLLLGDSFANIYSLESMGWGTSAGLAEHLSYALRRPIDRIVQNDAGAHATREQLSRSGSARLAGKKVVVWQFAARELAFGDWRLY